MGDEDNRRVAESLDPVKYIEHVTKTALLLEQLARDVSALRSKSEDSSKVVEALRGDVGRMERETAIFKVTMDSEVKANQESLRDLSEGLRWLRRLVIGAVVSGILAGAVSIVFKLVAR